MESEDKDFKYLAMLIGIPASIISFGIFVVMPICAILSNRG